MGSMWGIEKKQIKVDCTDPKSTDFLLFVSPQLIEPVMSSPSLLLKSKCSHTSVLE